MTKPKIGRPPLSDGPHDATLPLVRCPKEMSDRMEKIAGRLGIKVSALIRAFVDFCTLENSSSAVRSLTKAAKTTASSLEAQRVREEKNE